MYFRYIKANKEKRLIEHEDKLKEVTSEIEEKSKNIERFNEKEKELNNDIHAQEVSSFFFSLSFFLD